MAEVQSKRPKYGEYSLFVIIAILGLLGVIFYSNIFTFSLDFYLGMLLTGYGIFTIVFLLFHKTYAKGEENKLTLVWGYILTALGLALLLDIYTRNLLLNLSLAILFSAILGIITLVRKKG